MPDYIKLKLLDTYNSRVPIRGGVPFPQGALRSADNLRLRDENDKDVPFDAEAITLWPDESVRWLRLDFVAPSGQNRLYLFYGANYRRSAVESIQVTESAAGYHVNTGVIEFDLGKSEFEILGNCIQHTRRGPVSMLKETGIDLRVLDFFRRGHSASKDHSSYSCELEEIGANHAVFKIQGIHDDKRGKLFDYDLRLYCYGKSGAVRLSYTLKSRQEDDELPVARSVEIRLPLPDAPITYSSGIEGNLTLDGDVSEEKTNLLQTGPTRARPGIRFQYQEDGGMVGRKGEGWVMVSGEVAGITASIQRFWQEHPKGFGIKPNELTVELWPESIEEPTVLPRGCEKTHEVMLIFHEVMDVDLAEAALVAKAFTKPPIIQCPPSWYCSSKAMGELIPMGTRGFEDYGRAAGGEFALLKKQRAELREYGDYDYGDFSDTSERDCWFNVEYDTPHCLLTQFARTGKRDYLDMGADAARHQGDIDIAHYVPTDPNLVGSASIHATGHLGRESKWFYYRTDHTWTEGMVKAYWLTGDRRFLENARLVGDFLARVNPCPEDGEAERAYAWSLVGLMGVYEATLDKKYLDAAARVADMVLAKAHPERGLWQREWGVDECDNPILGNSPFMSGILVEGLIDYNAFAKRAEVDDFIVKAVRTWIREAWIEKDGGFHYHPGLNARDTGRPADSRQLFGLAYAYQITGDRSIADIAVKNFRAGVNAHLKHIDGIETIKGTSTDGKNYAIFMRTTPRFIAMLKRLGVKA